MAGTINGFAHILHAGGDSGELLKGALCRTRNCESKGSFTRAWWAPQQR
jgi:hypothetical protein